MGRRIERRQQSARSAIAGRVYLAEIPERYAEYSVGVDFPEEGKTSESKNQLPDDDDKD